MLSLFTVSFLNLFILLLFFFIFFFTFFLYHFYLLRPPRIQLLPHKIAVLTAGCPLDQLRNQLPPPTQSPSIHRWAPCSILALATGSGNLSWPLCSLAFQQTPAWHFREHITSHPQLRLFPTTRRLPSSRCRPPPSSQNRALLKAQNPRPSSRRTRERDRLLCTLRMGLTSSLHPQARRS